MANRRTFVNLDHQRKANEGKNDVTLTDVRIGIFALATLVAAINTYSLILGVAFLVSLSMLIFRIARRIGLKAANNPNVAPQAGYAQPKRQQRDSTGAPSAERPKSADAPKRYASDYENSWDMPAEKNPWDS